MSTVGVNPPKTPVTEGSNDVSAATMPNVCKMPGPPAPFVPTPLPNVGKSSDRLTDGTSSVKIEGDKVAIKGAHYKSQPSADVASQGTGGGLVSSQVQGKTEFVAPGSMNVKAEGANIQLLGDAMTNNGGSTANSATVANVQGPQPPGLILLQQFADECDCETSPTEEDGTKKSCSKLGEDKHACCEQKIKDHKKANPPNGDPPVQGEQGYWRPKAGQDFDPRNPTAASPPRTVRPNRASLRGFAKKLMRDHGMDYDSAMKAAFKGKCFPDAAIINPDGSKTFVDFNFPCPPNQGHTTSSGAPYTGGAQPTSMSARQQLSYDVLGYGTGSTQAAETIRPGPNKPC